MNRTQRKVELNKLAEKENEVSIDITISGKARHVKEVLELLTYMDYLGSVGHSTEFKVSVDGDGAGRINIDSKDKSLEQFKKSMKENIDKNGNIDHFGLD